MPIEPPEIRRQRRDIRPSRRRKSLRAIRSPEVPPPVHEPGEPPQPQELPGKTPDELPVRGPEDRRADTRDRCGSGDLPAREPI